VVLSTAALRAGLGADTGPPRNLPLEQWANPTTEDSARLDALLIEAKGFLKARSTFQPARELAADFVAFVDPASPGRLDRMPFRDLKDPAALRLRYEVGLAPPAGFLFMRHYLTSRGMPPVVARKFARHDNAAAMTIICRYVAIAARLESQGSWAWSSPQAVQDAISHEIVHAYINSLLEPAAAVRFPTWFHEGCAVYYGGNPGWEVTQEYRRYLGIFQYIAAAKGEDGLAGFVRTAVQSRSLGEALRSIGHPSQETLLRNAKQWQAKVRLKSQAAAAVLVVVIAIAIIALGRRAAKRLAKREAEEANYDKR
jgi:hypothetical protein